MARPRKNNADIKKEVEAVEEVKAVENASAIIVGGGSRMVISNMSNVRRGFLGGAIWLAPGEIRALTDKEADAMMQFRKTKAFQRLEGLGYIRLSAAKEGEELKKQPTPKPPADLAPVPGITGQEMEIVGEVVL